MTILKIEEGDITGGDTPNMPNAAIAKELSDEDVTVDWNEADQTFDIWLMYDGNTAFDRNSDTITNIYRYISQWKLFLSLTNELIKVYGDKHNILDSNDYTTTNRNLVFKLTKPAGWEERSDIPKYIELFIQLYNDRVYVGIILEEGVLEQPIMSVQALYKIYPIINKKLQEVFLHPSKFEKMDSWKDILKISPTEKETAQRSETWKKELNDLKAEISNDWGELEWYESGGYWKEVKVVEINTDNLTIRDIFEEMSPNEVKKQINFIDNEDIFDRHEGEFNFTKGFLNLGENYSVPTLILDLHRNPQLVKRFSDFSKEIDNYSGIDDTSFMYEEGKIQYRLNSIMEEQTTRWREFVNFKYLEKDLKEFNVPSNRAALFADSIVSSSPNITNITANEIYKELNAKENYDGLYDSIRRYLKKGQEDAWVKVITNMDSVYYVNTKTPAQKGVDCRIMLFDIHQQKYCVMTSYAGKLMPYGDHIATILMMISDEKGTREKGTWEETMLEI